MYPSLFTLFAEASQKVTAGFADFDLTGFERVSTQTHRPLSDRRKHAGYGRDAAARLRNARQFNTAVASARLISHGPFVFR